MKEAVRWRRCVLFDRTRRLSGLTGGIFGLSSLAAPSEAHAVGVLGLAAEFGVASLGQRAEQGEIHLGSLSDFVLAGIAGT
jgi:hypothetical protein